MSTLFYLPLTDSRKTFLTHFFELLSRFPILLILWHRKPKVLNWVLHWCWRKRNCSKSLKSAVYVETSKPGSFPMQIALGHIKPDTTPCLSHLKVFQVTWLLFLA